MRVGAACSLGVPVTPVARAIGDGSGRGGGGAAYCGTSVTESQETVLSGRETQAKRSAISYYTSGQTTANQSKTRKKEKHQENVKTFKCFT